MDSASALTSDGQAVMTLSDISTLHISPRGGHTRNCHLTWIEEYMPPSIPPAQRKIRVQELIDEEIKHHEDFKDTLETSFARMNHRFLLAAFNAYNSDYEKALDSTEECWQYLETIEASGAEAVSHVKAFTYLLIANYEMMLSQDGFKSWTHQRSDTLQLSYSDTLDEIELLYGEDGIFQALITAAQGMLAKFMRCQEKHIALVEEATQLDPMCAEWYRILYSGLRQRRRNLKPGTEPSVEETIAITKAYEIDPNICFTQTLYASMLEEGLGFSRDRGSRKNEVLTSQVIELWSKSLEQNPNDRWTRVRLAEMYAYGRYPHLREERQKGVLMFQEIEKEWPEYSTVFHKFGKYFYLTGQLEKAFEYYKKALDIHLGNYPCLMDYLKTAQRMGVTRPEMLTVVERVLSQTLYKSPRLKIMTIKGILLWLIDEDGGRKREACQVWIEAAAASSSTPTDRLIILKYIKMKEWDVIGKYSISTGEVVRILRESLLNQHSTTAVVTGGEEFEKRRRIIGEFIRDIERREDDGRTAGEGIPFGSKSINNNPRPSNGFRFQSKRLSGGQQGNRDCKSESNQNWRTGSPSPSTLQEASSTGKLRAPRYPPTPTAADLDGNWRIKRSQS